MPDLFDLFLKWWKRIFLMAAIATIVTVIIVFFIPRKYIGIATALPAASYATDKTGVFSQNLQQLYSALGTPDDLDRVLGTARLDTVYEAVAIQLNLVEQFHTQNDTAAIRKAACILKDETRVIRNDYGQLQVKVWDGERTLAAALANAIMEKLQQIHQDIQTAGNAAMLAKINNKYAEKILEYQRLVDSMHAGSTGASELLTVKKNTLLQEIQEYQKLLDQYKLMVDANPESLVIIERAQPALKADRPNRPAIIVSVAVLAIIFGFFTALVFERKRQH